MLRTRVLVAIVGIPLVVVIVGLGGAAVLAAVAVLLGIGAWELVHLAEVEGFKPSLPVALVMMLAVLLSDVWPDLLGPGLSLGLLLAMAISLRSFQQSDSPPLSNLTLMLGIGLMLGWFGSRMLAVRALPDGLWWTLTVIFCTWAADTGAYFIGRAYGRHKLAPKVSPKKTWEGYFGGVVFGPAAGALCLLLWQTRLPDMQIIHGVIIGLLIAVISPLGDLSVSSFKRQAKVKDSSNLIPGHGGMMDRLDSILIAFVLGYYYLIWFV